MKKICIIIFIISFYFIYGNNYEILEDNGVLFFKYSKSELSDEIKNFLEKNKEILSKDFEFEGEKNNIDKVRYHICKVENEIEKCILYMNSVRKNYTEEEYLSKNLIVLLKYDVSGKNPEFLSIEDGPIIWLKNNKLERYRIRVRDNNKIIGTITYIFDKKENFNCKRISCANIYPVQNFRMF